MTYKICKKKINKIKINKKVSSDKSDFTYSIFSVNGLRWSKSAEKALALTSEGVGKLCSCAG